MDKKYYYINTRNRLDEVLKENDRQDLFSLIQPILSFHKDGIGLTIDNDYFGWQWCTIDYAIKEGVELIGWDNKPINVYTEKQQDDVVNHPNHYKQFSREVIDTMQGYSTDEEFRGYLKLNIIKYVGRYQSKNGVEDLKKAQWYLNKLTEVVENDA